MGQIITLQEIVSHTNDLPTMSAVALKVMRETDNPNATAASISRILWQDPALTSRVLRLANSAYYGLSRKVAGVQDAVVVLGMKCIKNLSMVAATYPWLSGELRGYGMEPKSLWRHSLGTAIGSQFVAQASGRTNADTAFVSGLLHDLGKIALNVWMERKTEAMMQLADANNWTFLETERQVLGFDHCQVGAFLAERWNMPESIVQSAAFHHCPDALDQPDLSVDVVHLGAYLSMSLGYGLGCDGLRYEIQDGPLVRLGIAGDTLDHIAYRLEEEFETQQSMFEEKAA